MRNLLLKTLVGSVLVGAALAVAAMVVWDEVVEPMLDKLDEFAAELGG